VILPPTYLPTCLPHHHRALDGIVPVLDLAHALEPIRILELGTAKPAVEIFEIALAGLGSPAKRSALMVGDSLSSDIQGGRNAGIATCWYNPQRRPGGGDGVADREIATLDTLLAFVRP
jgi:FMN phosphatase YigB (HAD superfamily)